MSAARRTQSPPEPDPAGLAPPNESAALVRELLRKYHCLDVPLRFLLVVEGTTDIAYITKAADLVHKETGFDLLALDGSERITVCTPFTPSLHENKRGGLPQIERLADDLKSYAIRFEIVGPICFVLDDDGEGQRVKNALVAQGYGSERASVFTIDAKSHPGACRLAGKGNDPVVMEDLLSLGLQRRFFASSRPSCDVAYMDGEVTRIAWRNPTKYELCEFACREAGLPDVIEVARILHRVRALWRLEIPAAVAALFS